VARRPLVISAVSSDILHLDHAGDRADGGAGAGGDGPFARERQFDLAAAVELEHQARNLAMSIECTITVISSRAR
jgi:hypothetical protein